MPRLKLIHTTGAFLAACLSVIALPSVGLAAGAASDSDSAIIAKVGNTEVTAADIRAAIQNLDAQTQAAAMHDPSALSQVVRAVLTQRLVLKEALEKKWDQDPAVTAALARVRETVVAQTYLQSVSKPVDTYPSDAEIQTAYDSNKSKLVVPRQYQIQQIFIKNVKGSPDAVSEKAQVKLDSVKKALAKKDADFSTIARANSDDAQSAEKGGDLGWLAENRIQPEIRNQLGNLSKGTVSEPLRLDDGWHILKIVDVKDPYTPALSEIKPQLVQEMRAEQAKANSQQYVAKLVQENPIEINELNLSKIVKPQP